MEIRRRGLKEKLMRSGGARLFAQLLLLATLCLAIFSVDLPARRSVIESLPGEEAEEAWRSHTTFSLAFARYWYREGAIHSGLRLHFVPPRSIPHMRNRDVYASYPAGFVVPVHLWSLLRGKEPEFRTIGILNLWLHALTGFLAAVFVFLWASRAGLGFAFRMIFGLAAAAIFYLHPAVATFYPSAWWPDTLAPFWILLLLIHESFWRQRLYARSKSAAVVFETLLFFSASFTDWLPAIFVGLILMIRVRERRGKLALIPSFGLAAMLAVHLFAAGSLDMLWELWRKLSTRAGFAAMPSDARGNVLRSWNHHLETYFGASAIYLYPALLLLTAFCLTWRFWRREVPAWVSLLALLAGSCLLHNLLLLEHYHLHSYNVIKWAIVLVALPAVAFASGKARLSYAAGFASVAMALYLWFVSGGYRPPFIRNASPEDITACRELRAHSGPEVEMVNPDFLWNRKLMLNPECYVSMAHIPDPASAQEFAKEITKQRGRVLVFFREPPPEKWIPYLETKPAFRSAYVAIYELMDRSEASKKR